MYKLLFLLLLMECFFGLFAQQRYLLYIYDLFLVLCTIYFFIKRKKQRRQFPTKLVLFFVISLVINIIACRINRGQLISQSLRLLELLNYGYCMFFFALCLSNISIDKCEKILRICFFIACIFYLVEYFVFFPAPVIHMLYFEEEEHRMRIYGQLCIFLGYFYYLNRFIISSKKLRIDNIIGIILGFIVILTLGFRSTLIASIFVSILLVFRHKGKNVLAVVPYLLVLIFLVIAVINTDYGQTVVGNMIARQTGGATLDNDDYIRVLEWNYFTKDHFISIPDYIFGSGIPNYDSSYGRQIYNLFSFNQFGEPTKSVAQWRDWGIIGFSWMLGLPAAIILLFFILYMITKKTPPKYYYLSATYLFLFMICITTMEVFREGAFAFHALALYILTKVSKPNDNGKKLGLETSKGSPRRNKAVKASFRREEVISENVQSEA